MRLRLFEVRIPMTKDDEERRAEELLRLAVESYSGDTDEGSAGVTVPAPQKPSPPAPAVALPEPTEDESE